MAVILHSLQNEKVLFQIQFSGIVRITSCIVDINRPRRTMDSIRVSEAPDTGSIPVEATLSRNYKVLK